MTDKHKIADDLKPLAYPVDKLQHLDGNPRVGNVEAVAKSYDKFGQRKPIVATKDGTVISGNHQLAAAKQLGWDKIAVLFTNDDELTAKAFALADNRTSDLGTYDDDFLADMLGSVASDLELLEATSFDEKDLLALVKKQEVIEDEAPEIRLTEIKLGQKYKLGNHTLVCGDATNKEHIDYLIKDNVIDMVFTDPPYGMFLDTDYSKILGSKKSLGLKNNIKGNKYEKVIGDNIDFDEKLITEIFKINAKEFVLFGVDYYINLLPNYGKDGSISIWAKRSSNEQQKAIGNSFEIIWFSNKHKKKIYNFEWFGVLSKDSTEEAKNRLHPTMKPIKLINLIFNDINKDYKNILDIYGGSGSTLIACEQLERNCFIMEIDPKYCQVIIDRWQNLTGQKAELIESI